MWINKYKISCKWNSKVKDKCKKYIYYINDKSIILSEM